MKFSARSMGFSVLLVIKSEDFIDLLKKNPSDYEKYYCAKDKLNFDNEFGLLGLSCLSCKSTNHNVGNCKLIHFENNPQVFMKKVNIQEKFQV